MAAESPTAYRPTSDDPGLPTVDVFGVPIASLRLAQLLEYIRLTVRRAGHPHNPRLIAYANAHTCNMLVENEEYRRAIGQVDLVYADGNGPRLAAWLSGSWLPPRMTGADWIYDLCQLCSREGFRRFRQTPGHASPRARSTSTTWWKPSASSRRQPWGP